MGWLFQHHPALATGATNCIILTATIKKTLLIFTSGEYDSPVNLVDRHHSALSMVTPVVRS